MDPTDLLCQKKSKLCVECTISMQSFNFLHLSSSPYFSDNHHHRDKVYYCYLNGIAQRGEQLRTEDARTVWTVAGFSHE